MTDIKSLLKKADLFERLAIYGGTRAFHRMAQDTNAFNNVKKYLEVAKDSLRDDLFNLVGPAWSKWYTSVKNGLVKAPQTVEEADEQIKLLKKIRDAFFSKSHDDVTGKLENAVNTLSSYVGGAATELQKVKDFETNLMNTAPTSEESLKFENQWSGKVPTTINPTVQQALNELLNTKLKTDGTLGPQTATALQMYKDTYDSMKHIFDPSLYQDILQKAKYKNLGIMGETPF